MKLEAAQAVIDGLKRSGINFISLMPDSDFAQVQHLVARDPEFTYFPVSNEAIGVGVCSGAWLGGKWPALVIPTSGLLVATWPLTCLCMAWGFPLLLLIPYRGDIGEGLWFMGPYKDTTEPILSDLHIPYRNVSRIDEISPAISEAQVSTQSWLRPVAILLSGETIQ